MTFSLSFSSHGSLSPPFLCPLSGGVGWRRWGSGGGCSGGGSGLNFLCALSRPPLRLHKCDHQPAQVHLSAISEGRYYFSPLMIFSPCYDIIYLSFNLNVTDVTELINDFAHKMQNVNSWFWVRRVGWVGWGVGGLHCATGTARIN